MIDKDTLLKKLEALRSEPIQDFVRKDDEWNDYTEYVDAEKICKNPAVSCCVFTYNQEKYIRECLDSIVSQKADFEYEVLVCEDCSTDGTLAICREFQARYPEKVRIIHANRNYYRGALNFRRGYELARGEYIAICEGDDYWCNDRKIQLQYDAAKEKNAVAVFTDNKTLKGDQLSPQGVFEAQNLYDRLARFTREDFIAERFGGTGYRGGMLATATFFIRKDILFKIKNSEFGRKRLGLGDIQIRTGAPRYGEVVFLPLVTVVYREGVGVCTTVHPKGKNADFSIDCALAEFYLRWEALTPKEKKMLIWSNTVRLLNSARFSSNVSKEAQVKIRGFSWSLVPYLPVTKIWKFFIVYMASYSPVGYRLIAKLARIRQELKQMLGRKSS